jgi:hypothetical protein
MLPVEVRLRNRCPVCCPRCGGQMVVMVIFAHSWAPDARAPPAAVARLDTS